ncbi:MAG: DUF6777 domain-containing protein [Actinomycetes bacterium]
MVGICIAVVVVLIAVAGGIVYLTKRSSDTAGEEVVSVATEPVSTANNPFTPPIPPAGTTTTDVTVPQPVTTPTPVTVPGGQVGLYGGTEKVSQCDKAKLIAFLAQNAEKAAGWAQVQGITPATIPDFVNKLTQVVLRSDTLVTNHGWENGRVTTFESVLQFGTAVLVNDRGLPVVKCYCGNPLTAARPHTRTSYHGPTWPGWNPRSITIIETNVTIINDFTVINITNNQPFGRPTGTDGTQDGPAPPNPSTSPTPTPTGTTSTPTPSPTPTITSGREAGEFVKNALIASLRSCAGRVGSAESFEQELKGITFDGEATSDPNIWRVTLNHSSGQYIWNVDSRTGKITGVNANAKEIDQICSSG